MRGNRSIVERRRDANGQAYCNTSNQIRDQVSTQHKKAPTGRPTRTRYAKLSREPKNPCSQAIIRKPHHQQKVSVSTPAPQQSVDCQYTIPSAHTEVSCRMWVRKKSTAGAKTSTRNCLAGWRRKKVKLKHTKNNGHSDPKGGNMTSGRRGNHKAPRHPLGSGTVCRWQRACRRQRQPNTTNRAHCDKCDSKSTEVEAGPAGKETKRPTQNTPSPVRVWDQQTTARERADGQRQLSKLNRAHCDQMHEQETQR